MLLSISLTNSRAKSPLFSPPNPNSSSMDLVGRSVRKIFEGFGTFNGVVESFDPSSGFFMIKYEDGDSEEVDIDEIAAILDARRPKKRRRAASISEDPTLARETSSSAVSVVIQSNGDHSDVDLGGSAPTLRFQESPVKETPGLDTHLRENAVFEVGSTSCQSERDDRNRRKRQKLSGSSETTPEKPTRRSARARRAKSRVFPPDTLASDDVVLGSEGVVTPVPVLEDPKPELPPSSTNLDVDGLPVLDLISVYAFLRSFSRLLFLSPFRIEAFVAALRYRYANSLTDSIHFAVLQALKRHLEVVSQEGSRVASCYLRNLNWGLLDLVTWPVYLVEYMLLRGPVMRPGLKIASLKLLDGDYYKQPAVIKLEILRCLCDDVIEVEAIRSELNRRMTESDHNVDANGSLDVGKKLEDPTTTNLVVSLAQEVVEEIADGNIDECCLCKMDGNLICCDGCPAAFHSKCVGVAKDLLPEDDWYCPECSMERDDGLGKLSRPFRGAEILGVDPHGRIYFASCKYLLVSDSFDTDATYYYYNKNDLYTVMRVLKSSNASYNLIANAISNHWGVPTEAIFSNSHLGLEIAHVHEDAHMPSRPPSPSKHDVDTAGIIENIPKEDCASPKNCDPESSKVSEITHIFQHCTESSKVSEITHISEHCTDSSMDSSSLLKEAGSLKSNDLATEQEKYIGFSGWGSMLSLTKQMKIGASQLKYDPASYVNYYSYGRIASSIAEELLKESIESNNKEIVKSVEDIISVQLKVISRKSVGCFWYIYPKPSIDAKKEKCGWCFPCQTSSESDCLFKVADEKHLEGSRKRNVGLRSEKNRRSHLGCATHHILSIEDRVRALLSGPWEDPYHSLHWRKAVMKAPDVASLKQLLLVLESNLRRVALSSEWLKPVDSSHTFGPASHILTSSFHASPNRSGSKRQAKKSLSTEPSCLDSQTATTSGIYWWRGGRLSCQVFHWKMLPRSMACKSARQAGCIKIPSILYPDGSEPKRSKWVAWRASVEMSKSVAQLICQVKDFESNIRWSEISNAQLFPLMAKESKKSARQFKKVIIRRKCIEGTNVKYLLDFGKRETIPAIVSKHGVIHEESSDEKKKYWLNETHIPLNLVKAFEEKKLVRMLKKTDPGLLSEKKSKYKMSKPKRMEGLSHLFAREPKNQICGYCNKEVLIREAVNCQYCNDYFHKDHFIVPKGAITTTYTCCGCKDKTSMKVATQGLKVSKSKKIFKGKQLQKGPKKKKLVLVTSKKKPHRVKRGNRAKSKRKRSKVFEDTFSWHKRRRTVAHHSYWLDGLLWSRKPIGKRGRDYREKKLMLPSQHIEDPPVQPVCCLCRGNYNSEVIYIGCESCEDWFHGDVFYLTLGNIDNLIGFKCHKCRKKSIPTCPFSETVAATEGLFQIVEAEIRSVKHHKNEEEIQGTSELHMDEELKDGLTHPTKELIFYCRTRRIDGKIDAQTLDFIEAQVTSSKHESGTQIKVAPESDSAESHPPAYLSEPHLVDTEGGNI